MSTQSVFLFPGQGSQHVGMGRELYSEFPEFARTMEEASDVLKLDMKTLCFEDPNAELNLTKFTQPAILTVSTGVFRILQAHSSYRSHVVAGHSLGEYSALVALGALTFSDALKAVHFRGQAMQQAVPVGVGAMAAYIGSQGEEVALLAKKISTQENSVEIANDNCPTQLVLSGHKAAVEEMCQLISEKKLGRAKMLPVSAPFHSVLMQPAADVMQDFFSNVSLQDFEGKIVANVDAQVHIRNSYSIHMLVQQIASPVLWTQSMNCIYSLEMTMPNAESTVWIEIGPGKVLQGLAKKTFENQKCVTTHDVTALRSLLFPST